MKLHPQPMPVRPRLETACGRRGGRYLSNPPTVRCFVTRHVASGIGRVRFNPQQRHGEVHRPARSVDASCSGKRRIARLTMGRWPRSVRINNQQWGTYAAHLRIYHWGVAWCRCARHNCIGRVGQFRKLCLSCGAFQQVIPLRGWPFCRANHQVSIRRKGRDEG